MKRRGQTVVEALVCMALLGFLMVLMFAVYRMGANAWKKGSTQTELVQDLQVIVQRLAREIERSAYAGASIDPAAAPGTAVAFLSSWDDVTQRYDYDPVVGSPIWHRYSVCYYDSGTEEVRWLEVDLPTPTPVAAPLAGLAGYRTGGRVLARNVKRCEFVLSDRLLEVNLESSRKRYGSEAPEQLQVQGTMFFRNQ